MNQNVEKRLANLEKRIRALEDALEENGIEVPEPERDTECWEYTPASVALKRKEDSNCA